MAPSAPAGGWQAYFSEWIVSDEPNKDGEWRAWCPLHQDPEKSHTPSAMVNFRKGVWNCFSDSGEKSSCQTGTLSALWKKLETKNGNNVVSLDERRGKKKRQKQEPEVPLPNEEELAAFHNWLMNNDALLRVMMEQRGISKRALKHFKIGYSVKRRRYTVPVYDADGALVNVRMYDPHAKEAREKMQSWAAGYGEARLFLPYVAQRHEDVVLVEGEMDALCAQSAGLRNVMTHTGGSKTWKNEWSQPFKGKRVFVCYDKDSSGAAGMRKVLESLRLVADAVFFLHLPLNHDGADVTDYFVKAGHSKADFLALMDSARERPEFVQGEDEMLPAPKRVSLEDSQDSAYGDHPLEVFVQIVGKQTPAFLVPRRVEYECDQSWGEKCAFCPMQARDGSHTETLQPHDPRLLQFVGYSEDNTVRWLHEIAGAPRNCPRLRTEEAEKYSVEELLVAPSMAHLDEDEYKPMDPRRVLNVGRHDTPINVTARVVARNLHDPKDRRAILLSYECESVQTDLDKFQVTDDVIAALRVFQCDPGQTPLDKMEDIAEDLSANVTHIFGRPELHMAYDAVWHSVVDFNFNGVRLGKGWLELCVIGDTRTGKSEAAMTLARHYSAGVVKSCEGATFAGLIGGVQQIGGKHWMTTWGTIPLNDRRLVVLDEFGGIADKGIIEQMSSIRSSGRAQLTKIKTDETSARTRLIWIANPLDGKALAELHQPGISALQTLVQNPEDIARFDLAMACASSDVDPRLINSTHHEPVPHVYTSEVSALLVQWAWSRQASDIVFRPGVENAIVERATDLGKRYVPEPPLIQVENVRIKLARIAVAIAARTFSTDKTGRRVVVRMTHVESAIALLDRLYGMRSFAYMSSSRRIVAMRQQARQRHAEARKYLRLERDSVTSTLLAVRNNAGFKIQDFEIFGNMDRSEAQVAVKELTKMGMIRGISHGKIKIEPPLMELLQEIEEAEEIRA